MDQQENESLQKDDASKRHTYPLIRVSFLRHNFLILKKKNNHRIVTCMKK